MADMEHSSSDDLSVDSTEDISSIKVSDDKLQFSEDEETLIIRMFNLVGERENSRKNSGGNREVLEHKILHKPMKHLSQKISSINEYDFASQLVKFFGLKCS